MKQFRLFAAVVAFALWWGGLTVYASIVVPVGTEVFSPTEQGFVTQRVTHWINVLAAVWLASSYVGTKLDRQLTALWCIQLVLLTTLVPLHWWLDGMLNPSSLSVTDGDQFYEVHRLYLWLTTAQWGAGLGFVWLSVRRLSAR